MRYREEFVLFRRKVPSGKYVYYYAVYDEIGVRRQFSTGQKTKAKALKFCLFLHRHKKMIPGSESLTFKKYTEKWFIYDQCPYIQSKLLRGHNYSHSFADSLRSRLITYMWPYFGHLRIDSISPNHIEAWIRWLKEKGLSNLSINHYLKNLKLIFNEAERMTHIFLNPGKPINLLAVDSAEKGILTESETDKLFGSIAISVGEKNLNFTNNSNLHKLIFI